jgi:ribosomal protein L32E
MAQASGGAMLHGDGGVWLNGNPAPNSSAIFPHDVVQTSKEHAVKIDADGSTVTVQADTMAQFDGDELVLDHGSLQLNTARAVRVRVNCMSVIPLSQEWTRYDVIDGDGKMQVVAYQNDVKIHYQRAAARRSKPVGLSDVTVHQGEQVTREERCGTAARPAEIVTVKGAILNSTWAKGAGLTVIGVLTCWALCRGDEPISPDKP